MYTNHFGFREIPFQIDPDPKFFWVGERQKAILADLEQGVRVNKGLLALSGDVGIGKTTLAHALIDRVQGDVIASILSNPSLEPEDFLYFTASIFNIDNEFNSRGEFLICFNALLEKAARLKKKVLLVIDEAHHLNAELMEEIQLLSRMDVSGERIFNVFMVGQEGLDSLLAEPENLRFRQKISVHHTLTALTAMEVHDYIGHRQAVAGCEKTIFTEGALSQIFALTKGCPRLINSLCDHSLLNAFVASSQTITSEMVIQSAGELKLPVLFPADQAQADEISELSAPQKVIQVHDLRPQVDELETVLSASASPGPAQEVQTAETMMMEDKARRTPAVDIQLGAQKDEVEKSSLSDQDNHLMQNSRNHAKFSLPKVAYGSLAAGIIIAGGYLFYQHQEALRQLPPGANVAVDMGTSSDSLQKVELRYPAAEPVTEADGDDSTVGAGYDRGENAAAIPASRPPSATSGPARQAARRVAVKEPAETGSSKALSEQSTRDIPRATPDRLEKPDSGKPSTKTLGGGPSRQATAATPEARKMPSTADDIGNKDGGRSTASSTAVAPTASPAAPVQPTAASHPAAEGRAAAKQDQEQAPGTDQRAHEEVISTAPSGPPPSAASSSKVSGAAVSPKEKKPGDIIDWLIQKKKNKNRQ